jgi:hypothetical protein
VAAGLWWRMESEHTSQAAQAPGMVAMLEPTASAVARAVPPPAMAPAALPGVGEASDVASHHPRQWPSRRTPCPPHRLSAATPHASRMHASLSPKRRYPQPRRQRPFLPPP